MTVLGGDFGAAGGAYAFRGNSKADMSIAKLGGGGIVAEPMLLGVGDLKWSPIVQGNIGSAKTENRFKTGYLQGNINTYSLLAIEFGGGARIFITDNLSISPTISGIYSHTTNEFNALNANGDAIKAAASGTYVDWSMDAWSVVPSLNLKYEYQLGQTTFSLSSLYNFFHTESFKSSSVVVGVNGSSHTWENKLDVDLPLGWTLFDRELHTGGFISRTEMFGGVAEGLNEDHVYMVNGRLVLDLMGKLWKVRYLGIGSSYFWADHFNGWSAGLDVRLKF
jgi:hypothetical protein